MNKILILMICVLFINCLNDSYVSESMNCNFFKGNHELLSLSNYDKQHSSSSGGVFLVFGSWKSENEIIQGVKYTWKNNNGEYMLSTLPVDRVRLVIDDTYVNPYVKFRWQGCNYMRESDWQSYIEYAVFHVNKSNIVYDTVKINLK